MSMSANLKIVTADDEFASQLQAFSTSFPTSHSLMVVDFYTSWCGPCKRMETVIEKLALRHPNVLFLKVDAEKCAETALGHGVRGVPHFSFYDSKRTIVDTVQGADAQALESKIANYLEHLQYHLTPPVDDQVEVIPAPAPEPAIGNDGTTTTTTTEQTEVSTCEAPAAPAAAVPAAATIVDPEGNTEIVPLKTTASKEKEAPPPKTVPSTGATAATASKSGPIPVKRPTAPKTSNRSIAPSPKPAVNSKSATSTTKPAASTTKAAASTTKAAAASTTKAPASATTKSAAPPATTPKAVASASTTKAKAATSKNTVTNNNNEGPKLKTKSKSSAKKNATEGKRWKF